MNRTWTASLACLACACGNLSSHGPRPDAGSDSGSGGGQDSGTADAGPFDSGISNGTGNDSGVSDGGSLPPLTWGQLAFTGNESQFTAAGGFIDDAGTELYVGAALAADLWWRSPSGAWTRVYFDNSYGDTGALWVSSDGQVFAGGSGGVSGGFLLYCPGNCTAQQAFGPLTTVPQTIRGMCGGDAQHVYAVGDSSSGGALYQFQPADAGWTLLQGLTPVYNRRCAVAPDGSVYVTARGALVHYSSGAFYSETIHWPSSFTPTDQQTFYFNDVWMDGATVYAVGDQRSILSRDGAGTWSFVFGPGGNALTSAAGGALEAFAAGYPDNNTPDQSFIRLDPATGAWTPMSGSPALEVFEFWRAGPNEYYAAGIAGGTSMAAVVRGTR